VTEPVRCEGSAADRAWARICGEIEDAFPGAVVVYEAAGFRAVYGGQVFRSVSPGGIRAMLEGARK
jgi:hypothetical protein